MVAINALLPILGTAVGQAAIEGITEGATSTIKSKAQEGAERVVGAVVDPAIDRIAQGAENVLSVNNVGHKPTTNPMLDRLLQNNDLTPFPNIQRALSEPNGFGLMDKLFQNTVTDLSESFETVDLRSVINPPRPQFADPYAGIIDEPLTERPR